MEKHVNFNPIIESDDNCIDHPLLRLTSKELSKCDFCLSNEGKYKCPNCSAHYCSGHCYKNENHLECSESFYKQLFQNELEGISASEESREEMLKILSKIEQNEDLNVSFDESCSEDDSVDNNSSDLSSRLQGIDLDDTDSVWEQLSQKEKEEFMEMVKSGKTSDFIPTWKPWWRESVNFKEDQSKNSANDPPFMKICPTVAETLLLSSITSIKPSPSIPYNILNVLCSYVWMTHLFNGDHHNNCVDASEALFSLCPVLSKGVNYDSAQIAICASKVESQNYPWLKESDEFYKAVQKDVRSILTGPDSSFQSYYVSAALSDIKSLLTSCKNALIPQKKTKSVGIFASSIELQNANVPLNFANKESMTKSIRKISYFLSFVKEYPDEVCRT